MSKCYILRISIQLSIFLIRFTQKEKEKEFLNHLLTNPLLIKFGKQLFIISLINIISAFKIFHYYLIKKIIKQNYIKNLIRIN